MTTLKQAISKAGLPSLPEGLVWAVIPNSDLRPSEKIYEYPFTYVFVGLVDVNPEGPAFTTPRFLNEVKEGLINPVNKKMVFDSYQDARMVLEDSGLDNHKVIPVLNKVTTKLPGLAGEYDGDRYPVIAKCMGAGNLVMQKALAQKHGGRDHSLLEELKVGDKVKIIARLPDGQKDGIILDPMTNKSNYLNEYMVGISGQTCIVTKIWDGLVYLNGDRWAWLAYQLLKVEETDKETRPLQEGDLVRFKDLGQEINRRLDGGCTWMKEMADDLRNGAKFVVQGVNKLGTARIGGCYKTLHHWAGIPVKYLELA